MNSSHERRQSNETCFLLVKSVAPAWKRSVLGQRASLHSWIWRGTKSSQSSKNIFISFGKIIYRSKKGKDINIHWIKAKKRNCVCAIVAMIFYIWKEARWWFILLLLLLFSFSIFYSLFSLCSENKQFHFLTIIQTSSITTSFSNHHTLSLHYHSSILLLLYLYISI